MTWWKIFSKGEISSSDWGEDKSAEGSCGVWRSIMVFVL